MSSSMLTPKGQITIPVDIRIYLGINPGDKLEFLIDEKGKVILFPVVENVTALKGLLTKSKKKVSIQKMRKIIAKYVADMNL